MHVVIAGGHGKIGRRLAAQLAARGDVAVGVVRNPEHVADLERAGASAAVLDLESASVAELAGALSGADAVVFAAGAGPGSGVDRKDTVDRAAAILLADAAAAAGVRRYLLVSSTGVDGDLDAPVEDGGEVFRSYLLAKKAAEDAVRATDLDWTILRPGHLTDDPGAGRVSLAPPPLAAGEVTRDDTATTLVALLDTPGTAGQVLELREGTDDVRAAAAAVAR